MSLLHQNPAEEIDDAARGDEFTKGTSHLVIAGILAAILVTIAIAFYVLAGQKPPLATGEVVNVWVHPQHAENSGLDANGERKTRESFDQVLVFAQVRIHNQSHIPLFLTNILTNTTLPDGVHSSYAAGTIDYNRIFVAYPGIPVPQGAPLALETTVDPGKTVEGMFVSAFRLNKQEWDAGKNLSFTLLFRYQPSLVLTPHVRATEQ